MVNINPDLIRRLTKEQIDILKNFVEKKHEIPIRVVYAQDYWDKIAKDEGYQLASRELSALKQSLPKLVNQFCGKKINIVHLGVGNGVETTLIIDEIKASNIANYSIVDINPTMLGITQDKIRQKYPVINIKKFLSDIETYGVKDICKKTKQSPSDINIIFLTANGVLFSNDELVKEIFKSMTKNDYFFLTLELYKPGKDQEIIRPYLIPSVLDLLSNGIRMIGYDPKYEEFSGEIDKTNNLLKIYYSPTLEKSQKFLVLHSYKPSLMQLKYRMDKFGFTPVFCEEYRGIHTCACLFKKK